MLGTPALQEPWMNASPLEEHSISIPPIIYFSSKMWAPQQ